jgi:hypothetical protein
MPLQVPIIEATIHTSAAPSEMGQEGKRKGIPVVNGRKNSSKFANEGIFRTFVSLSQIGGIAAALALVVIRMERAHPHKSKH